MLHLTYDLQGRPAVVLANCKRYFNGLSVLPLYRNPPEQAVPLATLKAAIDDADQKFQAAINYDRVQIVLRNKSFKVMVELFKKVVAYLQLVATEDDIPDLLQAGLEVVTPPKRKKTPVPAGS
ncbi:hypothetical protein [Geomonas azotofigens]|uniref:hypothetical protein n=1 Tax=Geomonas azotofigens TaxID=2843196 RepID=UPI001C108F34|nr:hypothetical protein [Geomonas azotofigens]MBU5612620.1 hypothetical protein [Geomonas azotofigens]